MALLRDGGRFARGSIPRWGVAQGGEPLPHGDGAPGTSDTSASGVVPWRSAPTPGAPGSRPRFPRGGVLPKGAGPPRGEAPRARPPFSLRPGASGQCPISGPCPPRPASPRKGPGTPSPPPFTGRGAPPPGPRAGGPPRRLALGHLGGRQRGEEMGPPGLMRAHRGGTYVFHLRGPGGWAPWSHQPRFSSHSREALFGATHLVRGENEATDRPPQHVYRPSQKIDCKNFDGQQAIKTDCIPTRENAIWFLGLAKWDVFSVYRLADLCGKDCPGTSIDGNAFLLVGGHSVSALRTY